MNKNTTNDLLYLKEKLREVKDFPKKDISFKDITTILNDHKSFSITMEHIYNRYKDMELDFIAGCDSRGFIYGATLAHMLKVGFVPIRKKGKLPYKTISCKYALEYGFSEVEIHIDAFLDKKNPKVLLIDDLIATGGTAKASVELIEAAGGKCIEACFVICLNFLDGIKELKPLVNVYSLLEFD